MLRSPKEMVTASKVASANGSRVPSPAVKGRCGLGLLAHPEHAEREVAGHDERAAVGERLAGRAGAGGEVEHPLARLRVDGVDHVAAPAAVLAQGEHVVGDVVATCDRVEHLAYVGRLLVEVCAGHGRKTTAGPDTRWSRAGDGREGSNLSGAHCVTLVSTNSATVQEEAMKIARRLALTPRDRRPRLRCRLRRRLGPSVGTARRTTRRRVEPGRTAGARPRSPTPSPTPRAVGRAATPPTDAEHRRRHRRPSRRRTEEPGPRARADAEPRSGAAGPRRRGRPRTPGCRPACARSTGSRTTSPASTAT